MLSLPKVLLGCCHSRSRARAPCWDTERFPSCTAQGKRSPTVPVPSWYQRDGIQQLHGQRAVSRSHLLCPKHPRLPSSPGSPQEGREQGTAIWGPHKRFLQTPTLASPCPIKKYNQRSPRRLQQTPFHHPPHTQDEPLCKLPALSTDPGCWSCAQAVRVTTEAPALGTYSSCLGQRQSQPQPEPGTERGFR